MTKTGTTHLAARLIGLAAAFIFSLLLLQGTYASADQFATVSDPKGIKTEFPQQLELADYEKQIGRKLTFSENPQFTTKVNKKELPPLAQRLPQEPLVVLPYDNVGKYGGKLRGMAIAYESGTSEILAWRHVNLVRFSDDGRTIVPNVAKSWQWNDDYTEITFVLRKGHKWSDGAPFNADDILFYFEDIIYNKEIHKATPAPWGPMGAQCQKIDDVTFKLTFNKPFPGLLYFLGGGGSYFAPWAPKHFLTEFHLKYNPKANELAKADGLDTWTKYYGGIYWHKWKDAVVTSPFALKVPVLESHVLMAAPNTQRRVFEANPYYFKVDTAGQQLPYIDVQHERFLEKELWPIEIMNGNVDQKSQNQTLSNFPILKENEAKGKYSVRLPPGALGPVMLFNQTHPDPVLRKIYADVRFRQAMSLAINRDELNESLFLGLGVPEQALPQNVPFVTDADKQHMVAFDVPGANALLDDMGLKRGSDGIRLRPDGKPLTILWEFTLQHAKSAEFPALIADYWRQVGVNVLLKEVTTQLTREKARANTMDITMEWDVPYEPSLLSDPAHFMPPYLALYPLLGVPWMDWKNSGGSQGETPPEWVQKLWKIGAEWPTLVPGTPRYMELGKEMIRINLENLSIIGTLGQIPLMNVVSNRLGNVPRWTVNAYLYGYSYPYRCDQWYFK